MSDDKKEKLAEKFKVNYDNLYLSGDAVKPPYIEIDSYLINGKLTKWTGKTEDVLSPVYRQNSNEKIKLGSFPLLDPDTCIKAVEAATQAWNNGTGDWATMGAGKRIEAVTKFVADLKKKRAQIVELLMWEICKNKSTAAKEFDRTVEYVENTIKELKKIENRDSAIKSEEGSFAQIRRAPIGVVLCCGPFNYPFNELYCTLIPALLMGNSIVMKIARNGALVHAPTLELFRDNFPPGVINIISGSGRDTLPPIMKTGHVDVFAFIGTSSAADAVVRAHPHPHRLKICLGLDAKNPAIILPDADLEIAVKQCLLGSLSFNGQRCTALKILFVHESLEKQFVEKFSAGVDAMKMGLPWEEGVEITPLAEAEKGEFLAKMVDDALSKGAQIANKRHGIDRSFVFPFVLSKVTKEMKAFKEEQFGPVIPIVTYKQVDEILSYLTESNFGQQASVFSKGQDKEQLGKLLDVLVNQVCRVNLNCQCQRGPDSFPFTGRKDSAYGTLSVTDALRAFSIRTCVASLENAENIAIVSSIMRNNNSKFLRTDHLF